MKGIMLAIAAMAFATLAPFALAAEGQGDNVAKQPTMAELSSKRAVQQGRQSRHEA